MSFEIKKKPTKTQKSFFRIFAQKVLSAPRKQLTKWTLIWEMPVCILQDAYSAFLTFCFPQKIFFGEEYSSAVALIP